MGTKEPHFDESNIAATLHPPDKDYGFMKIEEPKTPFEAYESDAEEHEDLDPNLLAARIAAEGNKGPRPRRISEPSADPEDLELLSPDEREKRRSFEAKRKKHYNEFYAVKMARQLMERTMTMMMQLRMGQLMLRNPKLVTLHIHRWIRGLNLKFNFGHPFPHHMCQFSGHNLQQKFSNPPCHTPHKFIEILPISSETHVSNGAIISTFDTKLFDCP